MSSSTGRTRRGRPRQHRRTDRRQDRRRRAVGPLACQLMTTMHPSTAAALHTTEGDPVRVLEQPVSGGASGAAAGTLTVLSAGPAQHTDLEFLTATVAPRVVQLDDDGQPTLATAAGHLPGIDVGNAAGFLEDLRTARNLLRDNPIPDGGAA